MESKVPVLEEFSRKIAVNRIIMLPVPAAAQVAASSITIYPESTFSAREITIMTVGYSGTPLAKKLGIKEGMKIVACDAPENYAHLLSELPTGVTISNERSAGADIVHLFTNTRDGLFRGLNETKGLIKQNGMIWVSWYKKAAKLPTEITEDTVREAALPLGLVDVKVCAVDEKWSGLKLVIRRENRI